MKAGWEIKTLGEVCDFLNRGISPKYVEQGGVYVLNQKCVRNHRISYEQARRHDTSIKSVSAERFIQLGDVLVNSTGTGTLGRVAQIRDEPLEPTTVDSHVTIVRPRQNKFFPDFFGYMLILIEESIKDAGEGCGGQTELARAVLAEKFSVRYPISVGEQKRLVTLLDEAFESIATAKANAQQNLKNARALFESHLNEVFTKRGEGWEEKKLEQIGTTQTGSTPKTTNAENFGDFISFVKPSDFNKNGSIDYEKEGLSELGLVQSRRISKNSVLMVCIGATIGKCGYVEREVTSNQQINAITPIHGVSYKFVYYQMLTENFQRRVILSSGQATLPIINKSKWSALTVSIPKTLVEQEQIVFKLDALSEETQRLEALYSGKIAALDELKKALLHRAFSGEL